MVHARGFDLLHHSLKCSSAMWLMEDWVSPEWMHFRSFCLLSPGALWLKRLPFNWTVSNFSLVSKCFTDALIWQKSRRSRLCFFFFFIRKVSADTRSLKLLDLAIIPLLLSVTILLSFHLFVKSKTMVLLLESKVLEKRFWTWSLWVEFRGLWTRVRNNFTLIFTDL